MKGKKICECVVLIVLIVILFGCGKQFADRNEQTDLGQETSKDLIDKTMLDLTEASTEESTSTEIKETSTLAADETLSIRVEEVYRDAGKGITIICNRNELERYLEDSHAGKTMGSRWTELSEKYDDEWFESHVLLMIQEGTNSCDRFAIRRVCLEEEHLEICMELMHKTWYERPEAERESLLAARETGYVEGLDKQSGHEYGFYQVELVVEIELGHQLMGQIETVKQCLVQLWVLPAYEMGEVELEIHRVFED